MSLAAITVPRRPRPEAPSINTSHVGAVAAATTPTSDRLRVEQAGEKAVCDRARSGRAGDSGVDAAARRSDPAPTDVWLDPELPEDLEEFRALLASRIVGQEEAVGHIVRALARYRAGFAGLERPVAAFLLLGPTGVGKTLTVEALAELLHGSPKAVLKIHCGEFRCDHELARMKGAPPGYVGWRECVPLFHEVRLKEVRLRGELALVLFDEIEKAHPALWDLLLGLLDKGEVVLNDNTRTDFRATLVFLSGNAGAREVADVLSGGFGFAAGAAAPAGGGVPQSGIGGIAGRAAARLFSPEFRNRLTAVLTYHPLGWDDLLQVCRMELAGLAARLRARQHDWVAIQYEAAAVERIAHEAYEPIDGAGHSSKFGARHIKRSIERLVEDPLANLLASGRIRAEDSVVICAGAQEGEPLRFRKKV